jgi:superfamily I DNA and/or RNA helicase
MQTVKHPLVKIVDEAGAVSILDYAIALRLHGNNILIGDDAQLPPLITHPDAKDLVGLPITQLLPRLHPFLPNVMLTMQYRCVSIATNGTLFL